MKRYDVCVLTMFSLALLACSTAAPAAQTAARPGLATMADSQSAPATSSQPAPPAGVRPALHGPASRLEVSARSPQIILCECEVNCTATGEEFFGSSTTNVGLACSKARSACSKSGCSVCTQGPSGCGI